MTAPFVPAQYVCKVDMCFTQGGQKVMNVFNYLHLGGAPTEVSMTVLAGLMKTWWDTYMKAQVPNNVSLRLIRVTDLTEQHAPGIEYSLGLPIVGTNATTHQLPNSTTFAIKWGTGYRGRSFRGRTYHVGLYADVCSDANTLGAAYIATMTTAYSQLIDLDENHTFVVVSRKQAGVWLTSADCTPITALTIDATIDSQRRRLPGRGE